MTNRQYFETGHSLTEMMDKYNEDYELIEKWNTNAINNSIPEKYVSNYSLWEWLENCDWRDPSKKLVYPINGGWKYKEELQDFVVTITVKAKSLEEAEQMVFSKFTK